MSDSIANIAFFALTFALAMGFHWLWGAVHHHETGTRVAGWLALVFFVIAAGSLVYGAMS